MSKALQQTLWVTRTLPAAYKSAENFARLGLAVAVAPLLRVSPPETMPPVPPEGTLLVFTSGHGVEAYCTLTDRRSAAVVTVGAQTAKLARAAGFKNVRSADGTASDVTRLIKATVPRETAIIHCGGKHVRGSISEELQAAGYQARRDLYYRSTPVTALPKVDLAHLTYIALHSPLAATTLASFEPNLAGVTLLSISAATDAALGNINCQGRLVAKSPDEAAMLALLAPSTAV